MSVLASVIKVLRHKGPVGVAKAVYYALKIRLLRDVFGRRHIRKRIHGSWMDLDLRDRGISRTLLLFGTREEEHRIILGRVLRDGMTIFDIGANIGYYVLMERKLIGPAGKIVACEPSPENVALLKNNLTLNGCTNVAVLPVAISDRPATKTFFLSEMSNLGTFHPTGAAKDGHNGKQVDVEALTVPQLMDDHGRPDLIRMDIEGHEVEAFNGMLKAVATGRMAPMILFETHFPRYGPDHDMIRPLEALFEYGYRVRYLASTWAPGTKIIEALGYRGSEPIKTDFVTRVLYEDIRNDHAIDLICRTGGVRTVLLEKTA